MIGVVKTYDARRGLGEISREDGGADVAVFVSEVERAGLANLEIGQRLSFTVQSHPQRKRRFAVRRAHPLAAVDPRLRRCGAASCA